MARTLTPKELALELDTDARTLRKFLRTNARANSLETPGKGHRWSIEAKQVRSLKKAFIAWNEAKGTNAPESPDAS